MEYFRVAKFSRFCLKNMRINIRGFQFSWSFVSAKLLMQVKMFCEMSEVFMHLVVILGAFHIYLENES